LASKGKKTRPFYSLAFLKPVSGSPKCGGAGAMACPKALRKGSAVDSPWSKSTQWPPRGLDASPCYARAEKLLTAWHAWARDPYLGESGGRAYSTGAPARVMCQQRPARDCRPCLGELKSKRPKRIDPVCSTYRHRSAGTSSSETYSPAAHPSGVSYLRDPRPADTHSGRDAKTQ
jgi:hypothetical protein